MYSPEDSRALSAPLRSMVTCRSGAGMNSLATTLPVMRAFSMADPLCQMARTRKPIRKRPRRKAAASTRTGSLVLTTREFIVKNSLFEPLSESLDQSKSFFHFREHRNMTHLSSGSGFALSIEMELGPRFGKDHVPIGLFVVPTMSKNVPHHDRAQQCCGAQREPANRAELLLKLAGDARIESVVARIVRTRR